MKKLALAAVAVAALVTSGIAVARGLDDHAQNIKAAVGTFGATTVSNIQARSCTTAAGHTITSTKAVYTGTASGDPDLTGNVTIEARSTIDTTAGIGLVSGRLKIAAAGGNTVAQFATVYSGGSVAGTASGHGASPHTRLFGNLSGGFSPTGGFAAGSKIGGTTAGGAAVELSAGGCAPSQSHPSINEAKGAVTAVSSTSITVNGLTCTVTNPALVSGVKVTDFVEITCSFSGGVNTLLKIERKH